MILLPDNYTLTILSFHLASKQALYQAKRRHGEIVSAVFKTGGLMVFL